jgi:RimJ/RimL family protein N-acetyltransferase
MEEAKNYLEEIETSPLKYEDIEDIVEMLKNPEVCRYLFFAPAPEEVYRGYFKPIAAQMEGELKEGRKPSNMVFILRERSSGNFIGQFGVMAVPMIKGVYEVGYQLLY